jgi:5-methylcytosine-specific restriction endonuclease McrA
MPRKKQYTSEQLRDRKNACTAASYQKNKERSAIYHQLLHLSRESDEDYRLKLVEKTRKWRIENPDYTSKQNAKRRNENPELCRQLVRDWFAANPEKRTEYEQNRRAKKLASGGKLTIGIKARLYKLQAGKCLCCKEKFDMRNMHMDHVMPLSLGGEHCDLNIQLLCQPCNQSKHAKHPIDFMQSRGFLL